MASTVLKGHSGKTNCVRTIAVQKWALESPQSQIMLLSHHKTNRRIAIAHGKPKDRLFCPTLGTT